MKDARPVDFDVFEYQRVIARSDLPGPARAVLTTVAMHAAAYNDEDDEDDVKENKRKRVAGECFLSLECIVAESGFSRSTVIRALALLVGLGWLGRRCGTHHQVDTFIMRIPERSLSETSRSDTSQADTSLSETSHSETSRSDIVEVSERNQERCQSDTFSLTTKLNNKGNNKESGVPVQGPGGSTFVLPPLVACILCLAQYPKGTDHQCEECKRINERAAKRKDKPASPDVEAVWGAWLDERRKHVKSSHKPRLDQKRKAAITLKLNDGYTPEELVSAVRGIWASEWHRNQKQTDIRLALRDAEHIERFSSPPTKPAPANGAGQPVDPDGRAWKVGLP